MTKEVLGQSPSMDGMHGWFWGVKQTKQRYLCCTKLMLASAVILLSGTAICGWQYDTAVINGIEWKYVIEDGEAHVGTIGYYPAPYALPAIPEDTVGDIVVPSSINGYPVTELKGWAFQCCHGITSVTVPEGVRSVGGLAFTSCDNLKTVVLPSTVTSIAADAFQGSRSITSVTIPGIDIRIKSLFPSYESITDITLHEGCEVIFGRRHRPYVEAPGMFEGCGALKNLTLPSTVTNIGEYAFCGCTNLCSITIPANVVFIGDSAFAGCTELTEVVLPEKTCDVGSFIFSDCRKLMRAYLNESSLSHLGSGMFVNCTSLREVLLPVGLTSIGSQAFANCTDLREVHLPVGLTSIGGQAFANCTNLRDVYLPTGLKTIGASAFLNCRQFESLEMPASVETIGENAIMGCVGLVRLTFPAVKPMRDLVGAERAGYSYHYTNSCPNIVKVCVTTGSTEVCSSAFSGMDGLQEIVIPDSVTNMGMYAFSDCTSLVSCRLSNGLSELPQGCFYNCKALETVEIPQGVKWIGDSAFYNCGLKEVGLPEHLMGMGIGSFSRCPLLNVTMPETCVFVGSSAFASCDKLQEVLLPLRMTNIQDSTFSECRALTNIVIPSGVVAIGRNAFYRNMSLLNITIPESVKTIGSCAFNECVGLEEVEVCGVPIMEEEYYDFGGGGHFWGCTNVLSAKWPSECRCEFSSATNIVITEASRLIGDGAFSGLRNLIRIEIPAGVTNIGSYAFYGCRSLQTLAFPDEVKRVGDFAFSGCVSLVELVLPYGIEAIGKSACEGCIGLQTIELPGSINEIGAGAFDSCPNVVEAIWPGQIQCSIGSVKHLEIAQGSGMIRWSAFSACANLESVIVPDTVTNIEHSAFARCAALKSIYISDGVVNMGDAVFYGCCELEEIRWPLSLAKIPNSCFAGCRSLTRLEVPDCVKEIGGNAFSGCDGLTFVSLPLGMRSMGYDAFASCTNVISAVMPGNLRCPFSAVTNVVVRDGSQFLASMAFYQLQSLQSVKLPSSLRSIDSMAFYACSELSALDIPEGVTNTGWGAFGKCSGLTEAALPTGISVVASSVLQGCTGLTRMILPCGVERIQSHAFDGCSNLVVVAIPRTVVSLDRTAFGGVPLSLVYVEPGDAGRVRSLFEMWMPEEEVESIEFRELASADWESQMFDPNTGRLQSLEIRGENSVVGGEMKKYRCFAHYRDDGNQEMFMRVVPSWRTSVGTIDETGNFVPPDVSAKTDAELTAEYVENVVDLKTMFKVSVLPSCEVVDGVLTAYLGSGVNIRIPGGVTEIGEGAFAYCWTVQSLTLPAGIRKIGRMAFYGCNALKTITIPAAVDEIGPMALNGCSAMETIVVEPGNLNYMVVDGLLLDKSGATVVACPGGMTGIVAVPAGVQKIGEGAFMSCGQVFSVVLPSSLREIGAQSFADCMSLTTLTIPAAVEKIGGEAFAYNQNLSSVFYMGNAPEVGGWSWIYHDSSEDIVSYVFPDSVGWCGEGLSGLPGAWPNGDPYARDIKYGNPVEGVRGVVIQGADEIYPGATVGYKCIAVCSNGMEAVVRPEWSIAERGEYAVINEMGRLTASAAEELRCVKVQAVYWYGGVAFTNTKDVVIAPRSDQRVYTITYNLDLEGATKGYSNPDTFRASDLPLTIYPADDSNCGGAWFIGWTPCYANDADREQLRAVILSDMTSNVTFAAQWAYKINFELDGGDGGLPDSLTCGEYGSRFTLEDLPLSMAIPRKDNCRFVRWEPNDGVIPAGTMSNVTFRAIWEPVEVREEKVGDLTWKYQVFGGEAVVGDVDEHLHGGLCVSPCPSGRVEIPAKLGGFPVRRIGESAFYDGSMTEVVIPDGVVDISRCAFQSSSIQSVIIPEGVTNIGSAAFSYCFSLNRVDLPQSLKAVGNNAFYNDLGLRSFRIPAAVEQIGIEAFGACCHLNDLEVADDNMYFKAVDNSLLSKDGTTLYHHQIGKAISIPDGVRNILRGACGSNTEGNRGGTVVIPASVTNIGEIAFYGRQVEKFVLSEGLESLERFAFSSTTISTIRIPASVRRIGERCFNECDNLVSIGFLGNEPQCESLNCPSSATVYVREESLGWRNEFGQVVATWPRQAEDANHVEIWDGVTLPGEETLPEEKLTFEEMAFLSPHEAAEAARAANKLLFVLSGADWCPYWAVVKNYLEELGTQFTDKFVLYYCNIDTDTSGMAAGTPSYGVFDPTEFAVNWTDGLLSSGSGGVADRVQKVIDDGLAAHAGEYSISYVLDGGVNAPSNPSSYTTNDLPIALAAPTRDGCEFMGWTLDGVFVTQIEKGMTGSVLLTANWFEPGLTDRTERMAVVEDFKYTYWINQGTAVITVIENAEGCLATTLRIPSALGGYAVSEIGYMVMADDLAVVDVVLPDSLKILGDGAFACYHILSHVTLNEGLEFIGSHAFWSTAVNELTVPSSVKELEEGCFEGTFYSGGHAPVTIDGGNTDYVVVDGCVYNADRTMLLFCPPTHDSVDIPDSVEIIAGAALNNCSLQTLAIGRNIREIRELTFVRGPLIHTYTLGRIEVAEGNLNYSSYEGALYNKEKTKLIFCPLAAVQLTLPKSVVELDSWLLSYNSYMERYAVEEGNQTYEAYDGCLYDKGCRNLLAIAQGRSGNIALPASMVGPTDLSEFMRMAKFGSFTVEDGNVCFESHDGSLYDKGRKTLIFASTAFTEFFVAEPVERIGSYAFSCHWGLTKLTCADSVKSIGVRAFECTALKQVDLGQGLNRVENYAFDACDFSRIVFPSSLSYLGDKVFDRCSALQGIYFQGNAPEIGSQVGRPFTFGDENISPALTIYVVNGSTGWDGTRGSAVLPQEWPVGEMGSRPLSTWDGVLRPTYSVTYVLNLGVNAPFNPTSFTADDLPISLAAPTRAGWRFLGWTPNGGVIPVGTVTNVTFTANWEEIVEPTNAPPTVVDEDEAHVDVAKGEVAPYEDAAVVYDGYMYDGETVVGSVQVKVARGKVDKKSGVFSAKVTATVQLAGEAKKLSFKGGVADEKGAVTRMSVAEHELDVTVGVKGLGGTFDGKYKIDGARNVFSGKSTADKTAAGEAARLYQGVYNVAFDGGTLSVSVDKKGKAKIAGTVEGNKVSATSQLVVGKDAAVVPVVIVKKVEVSFCLWVMADGTVEVRGADSVTSGQETASPLAGKAGTLKVGAKFGVDEATVGKLKEWFTELYADYLPKGVAVAQEGKRWIVADGAKAGKLVLDKTTGSLNREKSKFTDNMAGLKLSYKEKDGTFKGSFKAYNLENGKIKSYSASVTGVMIGTKGYGTATIKKPTCTFPVTIE